MSSQHQTILERKLFSLDKNQYNVEKIPPNLEDVFYSFGWQQGKRRMNFSFQRLLAIIIKEFIQMKRDRLTFAMIIGIPLIQLICLGLPLIVIPSIYRQQ